MMNMNCPNLFSPLTIKGKTWKNRIVQAPIGGMKLENGGIVPQAERQYRFYSAGGPAEVIVGEYPVSVTGGRDANTAMDLSDPQVRSGIRAYARMIHENAGTVAMIELAHTGNRKAGHIDGRVVGPTSFLREDGVQVEAMDEAEIERTCRDFARAAVTMKECGFDGVVLHAGHGWLMHQFLSPRTNRRTDRFGGSLENRARLTVMILEQIRACCGEDFILECRVSGEENVPGGWPVQELCGFCRIVEPYLDVIHVSAGIYHDPVNTGMMSSIYAPHGLNISAAAAVRQAVGIPVCVVGGINSPEMAEEVIASGKADLVALGRQCIADPLFPVKAAEGRGDEIRGCLRCMRCFPGPWEQVRDEIEAGRGENLFEQMRSCSINPEFKNGFLKDLPPAKETKTVLVVGAGAAGMQAAVTAARRGHRVTVVEKEDRPGGILNFAKDVPHKSDLERFARTLETQLRRSGAEIRCGSVLTPEMLEQLDPDVVIAATGSSPVMPPIPGLTEKIVVHATQVYHRPVSAGERVVVLGGGTVGCETALHIARMGGSVTLIEMAQSLCADAYRLHRERLCRLLEENVRTLTRTKCLKVTEAGVHAAGPGGEPVFFPADLVVHALGRQSNSYQEIKALAGERAFFAIGDCVKARNLYAATDEGFSVAAGL